jgi:hypothetical protein
LVKRTFTVSDKFVLLTEYLFDENTTFSSLINTINQRFTQSGKHTRINGDTRIKIASHIANSLDNWIEELNLRSEQFDPDNDEEVELEDQKYFYNSYFSKNEGLAFKNRVRIQDWFEFNYYTLNEHFLHYKYDSKKLKVVETEKKRRNQVIDIYTALFVDSINGKNGSTTDEIPQEYKTNTFLTELMCAECRYEFEEWLKKIKTIHKAHDKIFIEIDILEAILKNIFRNGSGLLPAYIADKASEKELKDKSFSKILRELLAKDEYFSFVLQEIKEILNNYTILRNTNFSHVNDIDKDAMKVHGLFKNISPIVGATGQDSLNKSRVAAQFRLPGFPYVLITTDILKEGEDLHTFCKNIYHYGIAWSPIDMEQRTGRVDRIGSYANRLIKRDDELNFDNNIQVFFPYIADSIEVNQVSKLFHSMNTFMETFLDFTKMKEEKSTAEADTYIQQIPKQVKTPLRSKYEYKEEGLKEIKSKKALEQLVNKEDLLIKLNQLARKLDAYQFHNGSSPIVNKEEMYITGNIGLNGDHLYYKLFNDIEISIATDSYRRGPYQVSLSYNQENGFYSFIILSKITKDSPEKLRKIKRYVNNRIKLLELEDRLLVIDEININADFSAIIDKLEQVAYNADILEYKFTGEDSDWEFI